MDSRAQELLQAMFGGNACFREHQLAAIRALVQDRARLLLVQRTGWGKSVVYFIAAKILRDRGTGPALLISPLLSLMRNQLDAAHRLGLEALTINSANSVEWNQVEAALRRDRCDILMVSPERLASDRFLDTTLPRLRRGIGLLVVDEAHCISDWGHDFRPDYRRIVSILARLPSGVPVLATTATANNRVMADIQQQLGTRLVVMRGNLARESLRLQNIRLPRAADRLAWLAENVPRLAGSGVIYCLTVPDCERVAAWLCSRGIQAEAYHAGLDNEQRDLRERKLLRNQVKALVATVALGMGFDKPDLGFVIHYQRPSSAIAYYQQIGRAGRTLPTASVVLLEGDDDDRIAEYFRDSAFPPAEISESIVNALAAGEGLRFGELLQRVDVGRMQLEKALKLLEVEAAVAHDGTLYFRTPNPWRPDVAHMQRITALRRDEQRRMQEYVVSRSCLFEFLQRELDDPAAGRCGRCANCNGAFVSPQVSLDTAAAAEAFLRYNPRVLEPRRMWPSPGVNGWAGRIAQPLLTQEGRALCAYGDDGWGEQVREGKYRLGRFDEELVAAAADLLRMHWRPQPAPHWITAVPSLRHPLLVRDFGERLAARLQIPFRLALRKTKNTAEQKLMQNSQHQVLNLAGALEAVRAEVLPGPVLLVDDIADSRWTLTVCGALLRQAGSGPVYPFVLADAGQAKMRVAA